MKGSFGGLFFYLFFVLVIANSVHVITSKKIEMRECQKALGDEEKFRW